jgi:hypothetical protein
MGLVHTRTAPHPRTSVAIATLLALLASLLTVPLIDPAADSAEADSSGPLAVVVVGPVGSRTTEYVREGRRIATRLRSHGARVREVYSPNATWSRVAKSASGANLFVYLGQGRGTPGPYGSLAPKLMNGLGLNSGHATGLRNVRFYGESFLRTGFHLARGAVVIMNRVPYASGSSEPGRPGPSPLVAARRADNYAAGFLDAGAAAVFAGDHSVASILGDLFGSKRTMRSLFWRSPWTAKSDMSTFASRRTPDMSGMLALNGPGRHYESVVGRLGWTTSDWQGTWGSASTPGSSVRVTSIAGLLTALASNTVTDIVVANGTYQVSSAASKASNSLWIGSRFAGRTNPVTVRAETTGGVILDGGGTASFGGISFEEGAHDQTWQGFTFAHGEANTTGVIMFGGYAGSPGAHHISLRNITVAGSVTSSTGTGVYRDHAVYISYAVGGVHDVLIDGLTVDGSGGLDSAINFGHYDPTGVNRNAWNFLVRNMHVTGGQMGVIFWDGQGGDITVEDSTITNATQVAVRYETTGNLTLRRVVSTGSGLGTGFYSSQGSSPAGVTMLDNSFH